MPKDFPVMLASPHKFLNRITFPCYAQTKMDGMRAMIIVENGNITVFSRNGNVMVGLGEHFKPIVFHDNIVYDGELTVVDNNGKILDRKAGNGILHKAVESVGTISPEEIKRIRITLWDVIPLNAFRNGVDETPYYNRLSELIRMPKTDLHSIVTTYEANNLEHAQEMYLEKINQGEEGIILKNTDHPWENKRSTQIVKMKEILEIDLRVIGWQGGTGKYEGKMGALVCENEKGDIRVNVGTGFLDIHREQFTEEYSIGKIVSIQYNGIIDRKSDKIKSLFLPRFVEFRPDKEVAD